MPAENVEAAFTESLGRLQTEYVDLYYAHYDDESVSIADQARALHALVESGRVRHLALSNHRPERAREFFEVATREGLTLPVALQPQYNLVHRREYEQSYAPLAREYDVAVFPYYALAAGFLTGKYRSEADLTGRDRAAMASGHLTAEGLAVWTCWWRSRCGVVWSRPPWRWRGCWPRGSPRQSRRRGPGAAPGAGRGGGYRARRRRRRPRRRVGPLRLRRPDRRRPARWRGCQLRQANWRHNFRGEYI